MDGYHYVYGYRYTHTKLLRVCKSLTQVRSCPGVRRGKGGHTRRWKYTRCARIIYIFIKTTRAYRVCVRTSLGHEERKKQKEKKMVGSIEEGIVVDGTPFFPNHRVRA